MARKAYALLDNWEQYNNKTFAFHKARSPWLRWNPICWGALLVLGVAGAARLGAESPRAARALAAVAAAVAASILLFFVSARFRLPLAAVLAVLAGGALAAPSFWRAWPAPRRAGARPRRRRGGRRDLLRSRAASRTARPLSRTTCSSPAPPTRWATT